MAVAKPVAQVAARKEKMMRGERWMFLSELPWVIAVFITALVIMGIVVQVSGADISVGRWTPSDASQLLSARRYSMGTVLGIGGTLLGIVAGWVGSHYYYRKAAKDSQEGAAELARVNVTASLASVRSTIRDLEEAGALDAKTSESFKIQYIRYGEGEGEGEREPGTFPPGIWIVRRGERIDTAADEAEVERMLKEWIEEDDDEGR